MDTEETALLYAATALGVSQEPQGLSHLQGSMQVLSDRLVEALERDGGKLLMRHTVEGIETEKGQAVAVRIRNQKTGEVWRESADQIVANVPIQNLIQLLDKNSKNSRPFLSISLPLYQQRIEQLPSPSGAFVIYLGVQQKAIPTNCPPHLQFLYDYQGVIGENNSLFVSVSHPADGRAPEGQATIIASSFTETQQWWQCSDYQGLKQQYTDTAIARLRSYFSLSPETIVYQEAATPRTFERYTARDQGVVGGIGQRISSFGPFGLANRTPIKHLWLVGDSTHPGEGTAGVSYSALTVVRQIEALNYW